MRIAVGADDTGDLPAGLEIAQAFLTTDPDDDERPNFSRLR